MWLLRIPVPGPPPAGARGMPVRTYEQLAEVAGLAAEAGIASEIHAIGDAAVDSDSHADEIRAALEESRS